MHVREIQRARAFDAGVLGLRELRFLPETKFAFFEGLGGLGGPPLGVHEMAPGEPGRPPGMVSGIQFRVADCVEAAEKVRRAGGAVTDPPEKTPWGAVTCTVADPDGNEFVHTSPGA